jgi:hypothetical protein
MQSCTDEEGQSNPWVTGEDAKQQLHQVSSSTPEIHHVDVNIERQEVHLYTHYCTWNYNLTPLTIHHADQIHHIYGPYIFEERRTEGIPQD